MEFEFDKNKSLSNKKKQGIDFNEAQLLWEDTERIVIPTKNIDEQRFLLLGKLNNKLWSAIFTLRKNRIRLISVRRARDNEKEIYEG